MRHGTSAREKAPRPEAARWRAVAAVAFLAGLAHACGGRAQDTEDGDLVIIDDDEASGRGGAGSNPRPTGSTPARARDGEICYSPASLASTPGLEVIATFLPLDAFDRNGCLSSEYSQWVDGGGCNYDPRPALVRGEQCCHLLDATLPGCG